MIDVVAGTAVLAGAGLALLAGVGLVRLPDVFTRMHAAAKAATLGIILPTVAAALEVGAAGAVALLALVTALLFLSAPLGISLLARAAYHDADAPRLLPDRDDLAGVATEPESTTARERRGSAGLLLGWLAVVWVMLFASGTPGVALGAVTVAALAALGLPGYRPAWPEGMLRPVAALRFVAAFTRAVVAANAEVAGVVLFGRRLRPAIVEIPLRVRSRTELILLMNVVTFTPGTVAVELHDEHLYVHVMDLRDEGVFRHRFGELESRIIAAFGTRRERSTLAAPADPV